MNLEEVQPVMAYCDQNGKIDNMNQMINTKNGSYTAVNSYNTLNEWTSKTKNVWLVFHGMGYLSRYFLKYFKMLNPDQNYIIAPQAPSKYYQDEKFKHVGASWLTREETEQSMKNNLNYIDMVYRSELEVYPQDSYRLIIMGYSQGVSVALRWIAARKVICDELVLHSGGIPKELETKQFEHLSDRGIFYVYGTNDHYLTPERMKEEETKRRKLFKDQASVITFDGGHEVNTSFIKRLSSTISTNTS